MLLLLGGIAVFAMTGFVFWRFMPRDGKFHRFVGTEWEPYIGVAFTSAVALGLTMMLAGALSVAGTP